MLTGLPTGMCDVLAPHSESGVLLMDCIYISIMKNNIFRYVIDFLGGQPP